MSDRRVRSATPSIVGLALCIAAGPLAAQSSVPGTQPVTPGSAGQVPQQQPGAMTPPSRAPGSQVPVQGPPGSPITPETPMPGTIGGGATSGVGGAATGSSQVPDSAGGTTGTAAGTYDQTYTATGANSWGNWGWVGVFGLLGLFGLRGGRATTLTTTRVSTDTDSETPAITTRR